MKRELLSGFLVISLLISMLGLAFNIQLGETELSALTVPDDSAAMQGTTNLASQEPPPTEWNKTYGGICNEVAYALVQTSDGGYAIAGSMYAYMGPTVSGAPVFWLVKTDWAGNMQWNMTYGGVTSYEEAYALVQTSDGGYAIAGETQSTTPPYTHNALLVKTDSAGNMQWNMTYGGRPGDCARALVQTNDGGYALAGDTGGIPGHNSEFWLVKTDQFGLMQWNKTYGGTNYDWAYALVQTSDGGYALAGTTHHSFSAPAGRVTDFWLVRTDSAGNMQWNMTYGGMGEDEAYALVQTSDGGYALAGETTSFGAGYEDFWLVKTDANGNMQWNMTYGGTSGDFARALVQTNDGGYAIAGATSSFGPYGDFWLVKTDPAGNTQWNQTYGIPPNNNCGATALVQTSDGGYAIAGVTNSQPEDNDDFWLVKVGSSIPPTPDFSITASPTSLPIQQGNSGSSTITITSLNGFDKLVFLEILGAPSGVSTSLGLFVAPGAGGSATPTLTVTVSSTATIGTYDLIVNGTSDDISHTAHISLEIKEQSSTPFHQYGASGSELPVGQLIDEDTVRFAGVVGSPGGGLTRLEVELRRLSEYDGQFDETKGGLKQSQLVESGSTAEIVVGGLWRGSYHWRARTIDENGTPSEWSDFGNNDIKEPDFTICNKFKVTYPEGWMNLQLIVPTVYSPLGYLDKIKFSIFNKRDMWYRIYAYRRVPGESWKDITDQIWTVPYVGPYSYAGESLQYSPIDGEEIKIELKGAGALFGQDPVLTSCLIVDLVARWGLGVCLPPNALSLLSSDRWVLLKAELTEFFNNGVVPFLAEFTFWSVEKFLEAGFKAMAKYRPLLSSILIDMGFTVAKAAKLVNLVIKIADAAFFLYDCVNFAIVSKDLWASMTSALQEENVILTVEKRLTSTVAPNLVLTEGLSVTPEGTYLQGDRISAHFAIKNVGLLPINLHALTVGGRTEEGYVQDFSFKTDVTISPGETYSYEGELPLLYEGRNSFFVAAQSEEGEWITDVPTEAGLANTLYVDVEPVHIVVAGYLGSPGELHVYDSQGRVTGLVAGEVVCEIPHSFYYDNMITIFSPEDDLMYCVVGTEHGTYDLEIVRSDYGEVTTFAAKDIPTSLSTIHEFSFDCIALSQDNEGVIVQVDSNVDGVFEHTFASDSELTQIEYVIATDNTPPETQLNVGESKLVVNGVTYLTSATPIELTAEDDLGGSGVASTAYRIRNDTFTGDWTAGAQTFYLVGFSDGTYEMDFNSTDNAGNVEPTNTATVILDNTPPTTRITIGDPKYVSARTYVTPDTPFALAPTDTGSGVKLTTYRITNSSGYDTGWRTYSNPFNLTSLSNGDYTVAFNSTDNLGNTEATHQISVTLFSWNYVFRDSDGRGTVLKVNTIYKLFQFTAPTKDFGVKYDSKMVWLCKQVIIICYEDRDMRLGATAMGDRTCLAITYDKQAYKNYWLIMHPPVPKYALTINCENSRGQAIAGASVYVNSNLQGVTNSGGQLIVPNLTAGTYAITVKKSGYKNTNVDVTMSSDKTVVITMK